MPQREKSFENKIKKFLKDRGCWYVKYFANRNTRAGVPDILACVNGRFVAIEVKAENGKPTELQKWNVEQIKSSGGIAMILYPQDWERFAAMIDEVLKCK
jgi:Holliday junction resolvase